MKKKIKKLALKKNVVTLLSVIEKLVAIGGAKATAPFFSCRIACSYYCPAP